MSSEEKIIKTAQVLRADLQVSELTNDIVSGFVGVVTALVEARVKCLDDVSSNKTFQIHSRT